MSIYYANGEELFLRRKAAVDLIIRKDSSRPLMKSHEDDEARGILGGMVRGKRKLKGTRK